MSLNLPEGEDHLLQAPSHAHEAPPHPHPDIDQSQAMAEVSSSVPPIVESHWNGSDVKDREVKEHKRMGKPIMMVTLVVFILFFLGMGVASAAFVAYDKITLPNKNAQDLIRHAVMALPFTPKTSRYILENIAIAHKSTKSVGVNASLALSSSSFLSLTGSNDLDVSLSGTVDYHAAPNIETEWNIKLGNLLDADLKHGNDKTFIKLNTIPGKIITAILGAPEEALSPLTQGWMTYENNKLETEARQTLDAGNTAVFSSEIAESTQKFLSDQTLMKKIVVTETQLDNEPVYKLTPTIDAEFITQYVNDFGSESLKKSFKAEDFSKSVSNLSLDVFIGKKDFLMRKVTLSLKGTPSESLLSPLDSYAPVKSTGEISVSSVVTFHDYNKDFVFDEPRDARSVNDVFFDVFTNIRNTASESASLVGSTLLSVNPAGQFEAARDSQRRADLLSISNAVYMFASEHNGNLPDTNKSTTRNSFPIEEICIGTDPLCFNLAAAGVVDSGESKDFIVPTYIAAMPRDPKSGTEANTGYTIYRDQNGRLILHAKGEQAPVITVTR